MKKNDYPKNKIIIFIISLLLTGLVVFFFFLDNSLQWNAYKIFSCIVVNLWIFFVIPAFRGSYLQNKDKSIYEWFRMGFSFGASGIAFPFLLAPYYGIIYYIK